MPCVVVRQGSERDAAEVSLAENVERLPMNAADEHAAFARLADAGMSSTDIAAPASASIVAASSSGWRWAASPRTCRLGRAAEGRDDGGRGAGP